MTINVIDEAENTAPEIGNKLFTVAENITSADIIGTLTATDEDGDVLIFTQPDPAPFDGLFVIVEESESSVLKLAPGKSLNFEEAQGFQKI